MSSSTPITLSGLDDLIDSFGQEGVTSGGIDLTTLDDKSRTAIERLANTVLAEFEQDTKQTSRPETTPAPAPAATSSDDVVTSDADEPVPVPIQLSSDFFENIAKFKAERLKERQERVEKEEEMAK